VLRRIQTLKDVVDWGLCIGCGVCAYACEKNGVTLINVEDQGIRPHFDSACEKCSSCLPLCPGYTVDSSLMLGDSTKSLTTDQSFGPALEIWEGYAADPEIRFSASSGGLLTALSLYCLEKENMGFVLHTGMDEVKPWLNKTVKSYNRAELLSRTGSRYAPASPCDGLDQIEQSDRPCVFIGKPCDTAGTALARAKRPALDQKLGLVLAFFCAGTPSTNGTLNLLSSLDIKPNDLSSLRYRGEGWPGRFKVQGKNRDITASYSYQESWGKLTKYRPLRCHICPDGLGRVADLACGDAWEQYDGGPDPGRSIVLVRTERGRRILHGAMREGYVDLHPIDAAAVQAAQINLLSRRPEILGRLIARRLFFMPTPRFIGFSLFRSWMQLPFGYRVRTIFGSAARILQRKLWRRQPLKVQG
jgi:coenzyme F420 hydrogenase subunit beta